MTSIRQARSAQVRAGQIRAGQVRAERSSSAAPSTVVTMSGVHVSYGPVPALRGMDLQVAEGEQVAIMGPSGCGKSTLLHVLTGVLAADRGDVRVLGHEMAGLSPKQTARLRLERMGMVFQFGDLISELTLAENVGLPLRLLGVSPAVTQRRVMALLERLGIAEVGARRASEVSGGQAQRAAVARALVHEPALVLADEPTGALDTVSADTVMAALTQTAREAGAALLVVTHDNRVAAHLDALVTVRDGRAVV